MLSNWNRSHTLILIMLIGLAGLLYFFGARTFLQPLQGDLDSKKEQIEMTQNQLDGLTDQAEEADDELMQVREQVPEDKSPDAVLNKLRDIADQSDVNIDSIASLSDESKDSSESEADSQLEEYRYSLEVSANKLKNANVFLETIKSSEPFMRIDALEVDQDKDEDDSVDITMELSTFYSE